MLLASCKFVCCRLKVASSAVGGAAFPGGCWAFLGADGGGTFEHAVQWRQSPTVVAGTLHLAQTIAFPAVRHFSLHQFGSKGPPGKIQMLQVDHSLPDQLFNTLGRLDAGKGGKGKKGKKKK